MKKSTLFTLALSVLGLASYAGGIVTNANQSAAYIRMLCRDASRDIDAVYYNPAGLTFLNKGFHFSVNDQSINQNRTVTNNYRFLNSPTFKGEVAAPIFPSAYAAYSTGNLVISAGINIIGGGGSATFNKGLPSFEIPISEVVPGLQAIGQQVTGYSTDIYFSGTSMYLGGQLGASYKINDMISVFAGGRYVMVSNEYHGHLKSNTLYFGTTAVPATTFFTQMQAQATAAATQFGALATAYGANFVLPAATAQAAGLPVGTTAGYAKAYFTASAQKAGASAALLADQEVDVTQKGHGFTPILGLNLSLLDKKLDLGFKYEFETKIQVTNHTDAGQGGLVGFSSTGTPIYQFPDGQKTGSDMPAMLSVGASYQFSHKFSAMAGYHTYWDKVVNYGKTPVDPYTDNSSLIDHNYQEFAIGLEYRVTDRFLVSGGYLRAITGVKPIYQSDLSNTLSSNSGSFGGAYDLSKKVTVNFGFLFTGYNPAERDYTRTLGAQTFPVAEVYEKDNTIFALGFDFHFGK